MSICRALIVALRAFKVSDVIMDLFDMLLEIAFRRGFIAALITFKVSDFVVDLFDMLLEIALRRAFEFTFITSMPLATRFARLQTPTFLVQKQVVSTMTAATPTFGVFDFFDFSHN